MDLRLALLTQLEAQLANKLQATSPTANYDDSR